MIKIAKMGIILDEFMEENGLHTSAIQCWSSLQKNYGINVCTNMSMMSNSMLPSACEVDVMGALSMYALQLASGDPSALADWNNNYSGEEDKCVLFHCGNWSKNFVEKIQISNAPILGSSLGIENTYGAMEGRTPAAPLTYGRLSTDDVAGSINAYIGEGQFTNDALKTFGMKAVAHIPKMEKLLTYICDNGFEHHVAMNMSHTAEILNEAFYKYLGWEVYYHNEPDNN
jgi:L-fucose isomerase-like protein